MSSKGVYVVSKIFEALGTISEKDLEQRETWTPAIKQSLITIGIDGGYTVCTSGFAKPVENAWLYDLTWFRNVKSSGTDGLWLLKEVGLIMEVEWDPSLFQINYDFEKLLVGRSPIKAMIFREGSGTREEQFEFLENRIRNFHGKPTDETYILAGYAKGGFEFKTIQA